MTLFPDREDAAEARFVLEQQARFGEEVGEVKRMARWAAQRLGLSRTAAEDYEQSVVRSHLEGGMDHAAIEVVRKDLAAAGVAEQDFDLFLAQNQGFNAV